MSDLMKLNADKAAFPNNTNSNLGLSKREYFAGQVIQGLATDSMLGADDMVKTAVLIADKLLIELGKPVARSNDE